jgi:hypothetical protein
MVITAAHITPLGGASSAKSSRNSKTADVGYRFNIPYENVWHGMCLMCRVDIKIPREVTAAHGTISESNPDDGA